MFEVHKLKTKTKKPFLLQKERISVLLLNGYGTNISSNCVGQT